MKGKLLLSLSLVCALFNSASAQEFPIGIWFVGNQRSLDSVSVLGCTWIQANGGWDSTDTRFTYILNNTRNLRVLSINEANVPTLLLTK